MSDDERPDLVRELERELRVVRRKLERCQANQKRLEELKDSSEVLLRSVIEDMERAQRMVEERNHALERAAEALRAARQEALDASRAKSQFLAVMSHEIRTPLNGLIGLSELLGHTRLDAQQAEISRLLVTASENLINVVDDILDLSKIEAGKLQLHPTEFAPRQCVEEVGDLLVAKTDGRPLELVVDIAPELPERVVGDPIRLRQVLFNLVANAIKFTEQGVVLVRATTCPGAGDGEPDLARLCFEVEDTGPGIPADQLAGIFEAFAQADTTQARGTGLGLAIVERIVSALGGQVSAESEPERGSRFTVEVALPRVPCEPPDPPWRGSGARVVTALAAPSQCQAVARELEHWGLRAEACVTLDHFQQTYAAGVEAGEPVAALVLDDDAVGEQLEPFLAWRAQHATDLAVVLVARLARLAEGRRLLGRGVAACVTKPVKRSPLHAALAEALAAVPPEAPPAAPEAAPSASAPAPPAGRILVVEDDPINRRLASRLLERRGFSFDVAADGEQAVRACAEQRYALVLMDCRMPVMDGFEATRAIREGAGPNADTPIVALTAGAVAAERLRCLESGMTDVLAKPVRSATLYELIEGYLAAG